MVDWEGRWKWADRSGTGIEFEIKNGKRCKE